jgi:hypothetical protein
MKCLITLLLLSTPLVAKAADDFQGGDFRIVYRFDGLAAGDRLGHSTAGSGDVNGDGFDDIIMGAPKANPAGNNNAGSAYVASGIDGTLLFSKHGSASDQEFGFCVSGAGDVNADGFDDFIVGAPFADAGTIAEAGYAAVYSGATGTVLYEYYGSSDNSWLGYSVAGGGDINGDGFDDFIIGAPRTPLSWIYKGEVYLYSGADGSLLHQIQGAQWLDGCGTAVANIGDLDGDGLSDTLVGAQWSGTYFQGHAYAYSGTTPHIWHDGSNPSGEFGQSVAGVGDIDGDGYDDYSIGSNSNAYVYSGISGFPLFGVHTNTLGGYYTSVSGVGDINDDGYPDLAFGSPQEDHNGLTNSGRTFLVSGASGLKIKDLYGTHPFGEFGTSVAHAGDMNGDDQNNWLISEPGADYSFNNAGSVFVYTWDRFIHSDARTVSASSGGVVALTIEFPLAASMLDYKVLVSETGIGPSWFGVQIPLSRDTMAENSFYGIYPVTTSSNLHGTLNPNGEAAANFTIPPGSPPSIIGRTFWLAAIANSTGSMPEYSSASVAIKFAP